MNTPIEKYGYYGYSCYGRSEEKCHNCSYYNWIKLIKNGLCNVLLYMVVGKKIIQIVKYFKG